MWRTGRKLGRTLYRDEVLVGLLDTPELAAEIAAAMNVIDALATIPEQEVKAWLLDGGEKEDLGRAELARREKKR